ncbi:stabilin-2, partial [Aplysia californica]|uniref:Stabilin-2 n=1 Tax=Aplysia californica TaxID=6500 RepID=A0ABM1A060_APLCA
MLPHRCTQILEKEVLGRCGVCGSPKRCPKNSDVPTTKQKSCSYWARRYGRPKRMRGCAKICTREVKVPKCCEGFHGIDCIPCPGGFKNPCNGQGKCSDGLTGSGLCYCDPSFMGTACELCRQKDVFGPHCNNSCTCLHGQCDEGPQGSGLCKWNSCQLDYVGDKCNKKLMKCGQDVTLCHANAECYVNDDDIASCRCLPGYRGDGDECVAINPCADEPNGGCDPQATCSMLGPGIRKCQCDQGWLGDGFVCAPIVGCVDHSDCDPDATCYNHIPGQHYCVCNEGFTGKGDVCISLDPCAVNNGGCHPKANCTTLGPGERNCTCPDQTGGDGVTCVGTLAYEISVHPNLTRLSKLVQNVEYRNNILNRLDEEPMTFFAPSDEAMANFAKTRDPPGGGDYWDEEENVLWFLNFHTLYKDLTTEDFLKMADILHKYPTMFDGYSINMVSTNQTLHIYVNHSEFASFVQPDMPTLNGHLHVIDKVLEPFFPDDDAPSLIDTLTSNPEYSLFADALKDMGLLAHLEDLDEFTVFVPTNKAMETLDYPMSPEFLKYYVVPRLVFTPTVMNSDQVATLLGQTHRLELTATDDGIFVNQIPIVRADVLFDAGVLHVINELIHPVLNRCDVSDLQVQAGECVPCRQYCQRGICTFPPENCPQGFQGFQPPRVFRYRCIYEVSGSSQLGCHQMCFSNVT